MKLKLLATVVALAGSTAALAGPTALILIPIADILGHREAVYQFGITGNERNVDKAHYFDQGITVGLCDIGEIGFDSDLRGVTTFNAKVQVYHSKDPSHFAVSAGFQNIGLIGARADKYVVARYDLKAVRLHAGVLDDDRSRVMLGVDGPLPKDWSYAADFISGPGSYVWTSLHIPLPPRGLDLSIAVGVPLDHGNGIQHQLGVSYGFKL